MLKAEKSSLEEEKESLQHALALSEAKHQAANKYLDEMETELTSDLLKLREEKERLRNNIEAAEADNDELAEQAKLNQNAPNQNKTRDMAHPRPPQKIRDAQKKKREAKAKRKE